GRSSRQLSGRGRFAKSLPAYLMSFFVLRKPKELGCLDRVASFNKRRRLPISLCSQQRWGWRYTPRRRPDTDSATITFSATSPVRMAATSASETAGPGGGDGVGARAGP